VTVETIRQYSNGRWQAIIRSKGEKRGLKGVREEAQRWARLLGSESDRGVFVNRTKAPRTTLGDLMDRRGLSLRESERQGPG
jgi:hypothetical protein